MRPPGKSEAFFGLFRGLVSRSGSTSGPESLVLAQALPDDLDDRDRELLTAPYSPGTSSADVVRAISRCCASVQQQGLLPGLVLRLEDAPTRVTIRFGDSDGRFVVLSADEEPGEVPVAYLTSGPVSRAGGDHPGRWHPTPLPPSQTPVTLQTIRVERVGLLATHACIEWVSAARSRPTLSHLGSLPHSADYGGLEALASQAALDSGCFTPLPAGCPQHTHHITGRWPRMGGQVDGPSPASAAAAGPPPAGPTGPAFP